MQFRYEINVLFLGLGSCSVPISSYTSSGFISRPSIMKNNTLLIQIDFNIFSSKIVQVDLTFLGIANHLPFCIDRFSHM